MVVQKSLEQRAQEAAEMIFELRKKRVQIVTGDTDATYSGEAMGAALSEIAALEKEYMSMFIGYSDFQTQKLKCDVVPEKDRKSQTYVAFRISDTDGIVSADNMSGKPYLIELTPQPVSPASGRGTAAKGNVAVYRIPAICSVKLTDGVNPILQDRVAVYQLGVESYFPLSSTTATISSILNICSGTSSKPLWWKSTTILSASVSVLQSGPACPRSV